MASIVSFFGVVINMINKGGEKNKRQNCCYAKEIGFSNEKGNVLFKKSTIT